MISPLAYVPRREPLQSASLSSVSLYLGAFLVVGFLSSDPLILVAAAAGAAIAGLSCGAGKAVTFSFRLGFFLMITMVIVNALVTGRGATVLFRFGELPLVGRMDVTLEAIAAGLVIGLRVMATMIVIGVWSACVDPDRIMRAARGVARRSALTATLVSRLVPLASADLSRLGEAARLRGPGSEPVGRAAMANRLLAGSLDRAVDVAATLEVRGYGMESPPGGYLRAPSRYDGRFFLVGLVLLAVSGLLLLTGAGALDPYPTVSWSPNMLSVGAAAIFCLAGLAARRKGSGVRAFR